MTKSQRPVRGADALLTGKEQINEKQKKTDKIVKFSDVEKALKALFAFIYRGHSLIKMTSSQQQMFIDGIREKIPDAKEKMNYKPSMSDAEFEEWVRSQGFCNVDIDADIRMKCARDLIDAALEELEEDDDE